MALVYNLYNLYTTLISPESVSMLHQYKRRQKICYYKLLFYRQLAVLQIVVELQTGAGLMRHNTI